MTLNPETATVPAADFAAVRRARLVTYARAVAGREHQSESEDIVHEALLAFYQYHERHDHLPDQDREAYLFAVTRNTAHRWRQRNRRTPGPLGTAPEPAHELHPALDAAYHECKAAAGSALAKALATIDERQRDALVLCYYEGLTREEAAERLGIEERAVYRRLANGIQALGARIERVVPALQMLTARHLGGADHDYLVCAEAPHANVPCRLARLELLPSGHLVGQAWVEFPDRDLAARHAAPVAYLTIHGKGGASLPSAPFLIAWDNPEPLVRTAWLCAFVCPHEIRTAGSVGIRIPAERVRLHLFAS